MHNCLFLTMILNHKNLKDLFIFNENHKMHNIFINIIEKNAILINIII